MSGLVRLGRLLLGVMLAVAAPSSGWTAECACRELKIAIDVGHAWFDGGATSSRGKSEFDFNLAMGNQILDQLVMNGYRRAFAIVNPPNLRERVRIAETRQADLLISIHHDSVQPMYLKPWEHNGRKQRYSDAFKGYSILVSTKSLQFTKSLEFAKLLGGNFRAAGFQPAYHHSRKVVGGRHNMLDENLGIYQFDNLVVLKYPSIPAVLIEFGVIVHRDEEILLGTPETREKMTRAVVDAVKRFNALECPA
ncbi:MAG: N-acetylmuramoyl-L-alanine amidase [Magnetococcales bacterium]|nr:N-acetylmuramoyl-L-alanine amidase [Magnetococcales bacterium]